MKADSEVSDHYISKRRRPEHPDIRRKKSEEKTIHQKQLCIEVVGRICDEVSGDFGRMEVVQSAETAGWTCLGRSVGKDMERRAGALGLWWQRAGEGLLENTEWEHTGADGQRRDDRRDDSTKHGRTTRLEREDCSIFVRGPRSYLHSCP